ncbi:hypothetical protein [Streptomyces sp. enrichment culture]|uniref:hypothetical protein n=1 Tax=Streptomyces sp. enrichment culture TaxID=1795815 RepID=UPI003F56A2CE
MDFLVMQDIFLTRTAELAHVVLPATAGWAETDGTTTRPWATCCGSPKCGTGCARCCWAARQAVSSAPRNWTSRSPSKGPGKRARPSSPGSSWPSTTPCRCPGCCCASRWSTTRR